MRRFIRGVAMAAIAASWPAVAAANDQETSQAIAGALRASGQLVDYSIGVKFQEGTAVLQGRVASEQQRDTARVLVQQMEGVTNVVDRLEIKSTRGPESAAGPNVRFSGEQAPQMPATSQMPAASQVVRPEQMPVQQQVSQTGGLSLKSLLGHTPSAVQPATAQMPAGTQPQLHTQAPARSFNDPGDPLKQSQSAKFSPSASRRFTNEPPAVSTKQPVQRVAAKAPVADSRAIRQVSQVEMAPPGPGGPACPPQGPMQFAGPPPGGPAMAPVSRVGYHHARAVGPMYGPAMGGCYGGGCNPPAYEQPNMPGYAWPSYAAYPNYGAVTYPRQYSPTAWPYIGPFYPYPQVPLGWRKVSLEWDDGWWWLDFTDHHKHH